MLFNANFCGSEVTTLTVRGLEESNTRMGSSRRELPRHRRKIIVAFALVERSFEVDSSEEDLRRLCLLPRLSMVGRRRPDRRGERGGAREGTRRGGGLALIRAPSVTGDHERRLCLPLSRPRRGSHSPPLEW
jgi:hypothetical protein